MKSELIWKEKLQFNAVIGEHTVPMDAKPPIGQGTAPSPKDLLLSSIAACSAMDVVTHMRKHKIEMTSFAVDSDSETTSGYPAIFKSVKLIFKVHGKMESAELITAVQNSQSKYCGVSAMVSKVVPIHWIAILNDTQVGEGAARFDI